MMLPPDNNRNVRPPSLPTGVPITPKQPANSKAGWISLTLAIVGWAVLLIALVVYNPPYLGRTVVDGKLLPDTSHFMVRPLVFASCAMIGAIVTGLVGHKSIAGLLGIAAGLSFFGLALMMFLSAY